jgi:threonine dehydrogenase-like Zn-dependent dehydrogenase
VSMIYAGLAHLEGAAQVLMVVRSEDKAALVRHKLGPWVQVYVMPHIPDEATPEALAAEDAVVRDLTALTGGALFDDVVSACASPQAQRLMLRLYTPEGYAVGACFGGTHRLVDAANVDIHHYRAATTIGTSGCSTDCMRTILGWLAADRLDLNGFISSRRFTLDDDPHEFFTSEADGLKPALFMAEG